MKNSEAKLVERAIKSHQRLEYHLNWHNFNIIKSFAYASASARADENKYQYPSVKCSAAHMVSENLKISQV